MAHPFQDGVLFEPRPQHREIIDDVERPDVEAALAFRQGLAGQIIDDLTFAGGRSRVEDQNRKNVLVHSGLLNCVNLAKVS